MLLRAILSGEVWNGFLLGQAKKKFRVCTFLPILHVRELREFLSLMSLDRSNWPRCLLWHGWLPGPSLYGEKDPGLLHLGSWLIGS